jgi:MoaA/NifB/PqqE/SkfB family radical SAM enzyme
MCDSWKKNANDDLTPYEIRSILRQLPQMDFVRLSGGEPFLRSDLLDIAHAVQSIVKPVGLHITTNGVLTDRIVKFCEERRKTIRLYLLVSLDGIGKTHDAIRGRNNVWDRTIRTIELLASRRKQLRLQLSVNQTIVNDKGIEDYGRLRDFLKPLGIQNSIVFGYDESATYHENDEISFRPDSAERFNSYGRYNEALLSSFFDVVQKDMATYPLLTRLAKQYYIKGIKNRLLHGMGSPNPKCVALSSHLRLMPDGSLPTCQFDSTRIGDLRRQDFASVWFGKTFDRQRQWIKRCPGCWAECEILPNAFYSGDIAGLLRN